MANSEKDWIKRTMYKLEDGKFQCKLCDKKLVTSVGMKKHLISIHGNPVIVDCVEPTCDRKFLSADAMGRHAIKMHGEGTAECPNQFCEYQSNDSIK